MIAPILTLIVGVVVAGFVFAPLFRGDSSEPEELSAAVCEMRDLQSKREMLLASLKDLEDDRATEKIGDDDFRELQATLSAQAVEVMKRMDALGEEEARGVSSLYSRRGAPSRKKPSGSSA